MPKSSAILSPNLGLYYGLDALTIPSRAIKDGRQFRITQGKVNNEKLGWTAQSVVDFENPIMMIETFYIRGAAQKNFIATTRDVYEYDLEADTALFLNIRYSTGTVNLGGNDTYTKVLLHCDGTNAGTTFTDSNLGGSAHTWTAAGNAQTQTADKVFGTASALFDGTGDWVTTPDHADFALGSSDFCIDGRFKTTKAGGTLEYIAGQCDASITATTASFILGRTAANVISATVWVGASAFTVTGTTQFTNALNTGWHHVAVTRTGGFLKLWIDGVQEGASVAIAGSVNDSASVLAIGAAGAVTTTPWIGGIDEFRISVGAVRFTAAFTIPTAAYAAANILTGVGTLWVTAGGKAGDFVHLGAASYRTTTAAQWYEIASVDSETQITLVSSAIAPTTTPQAYTIRSVFTGDTTDMFDSATFVAPDDGLGGVGDDVLVVTNGVEAIMSWDGSATQMTSHAAMGFTCKVLTVFKNMMIYGDLIYGGDTLPTSIVNSNPGSPFVAGDLGTGLSEQTRVNDGVFPIRAMNTLGDNLVIYSTRNITLCQFVGSADLVFALRAVSESIGPLANRLLADYGDYHQFLGQDSMYLFDGVTVSQVNQQVWRETLRQRDALRETLGYCHFDEEHGEVIWALPLTSDAGTGVATNGPEEAFVEHYLEEVGDKVPTPYSRRQMPFLCLGYGTVLGSTTWSEMTDTWANTIVRWNDSFLHEAFPLILAGSDDGTLYVINTVQQGAGVDLPSYVITGRRVLGDGRMRGLLTRVYPYAAQYNNDLTVTVRLFDHARGPVAISDAQAFDTTLNEGEHFTQHYRRGRYFELQFGSPGTVWELSGWDTDVRAGGTR